VTNRNRRSIVTHRVPERSACHVDRHDDCHYPSTVSWQTTTPLGSQQPLQIIRFEDKALKSYLNIIVKCPTHLVPNSRRSCPQRWTWAIPQGFFMMSVLMSRKTSNETSFVIGKRGERSNVLSCTTQLSVEHS
jgi:hypothetical protein